MSEIQSFARTAAERQISIWRERATNFAFSAAERARLDRHLLRLPLRRRCE